MRRGWGLLAVWLAATGCATTGSGRTAMEGARCFPIEGLPPADQAWATRLLLEAADGNALYTLAGGLKPISSDGGTLQWRVFPAPDRAALDSLDRLRRIAAALSCGEVGAFVQPFAATYPGRAGDSLRSADLVFYHRRALSRAIAAHPEAFLPIGVTPATPGPEAVHAVEHAPRALRWQGYGHLFGYPDSAVAFFVRAGVEGDSTRRLVPRDFRRIETWRKYPAAAGAPPTLSAFVYAVPRGAAPTAGDSALAAGAAPIFAEYADRRQRLGSDTAGVVALLRRWPRVGR